MKSSITTSEIEHIQNNWGKGVVNLGKAYLEKKNVNALAEIHVEKFYGYKYGKVLFKPTKASNIQFRNTFESAVSYFVGGNKDYPEDHGFALNPWTNVRFENSDIIINQDKALAMGNYFFTDLKGNEIKVEYSFGYFKTKEGELKINLHHSSIPYTNK